MPLYEAVRAEANRAFDQLGVQGYFMCHLSHSYHAGACLYFTFAFKASSQSAMLPEYEVVKSAIQQAFVDNGATLSHHHAVGTEHSQWLLEDISAPGVAMMRSLFEGFDPGRHMNPGKIVPSESAVPIEPAVPGD
jgi:alkyldihydroxyacetonephosphate synthase